MPNVIPRRGLGWAIASTLLLASASCAPPPARSAQPVAPFQVEEATIADLHAAITSGRTTCRAVVEAYVARAKAYNGVCTSLVTPDGADVPPATGYVRAGAALRFPAKTTRASALFPDLDRYRGKPLDYGRMEPTVSNPGVMAQMGMRVGIPDAGQVNALETLNLRGERSQTCRGAFDRHPSTGPLPDGAPAACEEFRKQPDALERAAELDATFGATPDLAAMPMYCVVTAVKDPYDTKDMRTTANSDVAFATDAPPTDATLVARLRAKGAIIYAKSSAAEFNSGPGDPGGTAESRTNTVGGGQAIGAWGGQACNPYDTERVPRGSSSGSGAAVAANLAAIGICEQTGGSCQGPASRNGIAMLLPGKGIIPGDGGIGYGWLIDRAGVHARTLADTAKVLDALREPDGTLYDSRDPLSAVSAALVPAAPYASFAVGSAAVAGGAKPLQGMRIAILREHMVKATPNHEAIPDALDREMKTVLRDRLGAELVETRAANVPDDPEVPDVTYTFADALSELLPRLLPEVFTRRDAKGQLLFAVPGHDVTTYAYLLALSRRQAPLTPAIDLTNFATYGIERCYTGLCGDVAMDIDRYLAARGDATIKTWADWIRHAKFREDASRAGAENWLALPSHGAPWKTEHVARSYVGRLALERMMRENRIAAFVHPENTVPTPKIQGPNVGTNSLDGITPFFQIPRVVVPAGMSDVVVEPMYALNADRTDYVSVIREGTPRTSLPHAMPIALTFFAGQGQESTLIRIGTAYEAATAHRTPPQAFGPLPGR